MNEQEKKSILDEAALRYKEILSKFDALTQKFKTSFPDIKFDNSKYQWNRELGIGNYTNFLNVAEKICKDVDNKFGIKNGGGISYSINERKATLSKNVEDLEKIMNNGSDEEGVNQANEYLDYIINTTGSAVVASSRSFDISNDKKKRSEQRNECLKEMNEKISTLVTEYKKVSSNYEYTENQKPKDFAEVRNLLEEIYKEASKAAGNTIDEGKYNKFQEAVQVYFKGGSNFEGLNNSFNDLYEAVSKSVKAIPGGTNVNHDKDLKSKEVKLDLMNARLEKLAKKFKKICPEYEYKPAKDFLDVEKCLTGIYKFVCEKNGQQIDRNKVKPFQYALMNGSKLDSIGKSFDEEYECVSGIINEIRLQSKKSDVMLKRQFETIYETKVLPLFKVEDDKIRFAKFKRMYKGFKNVKKDCPKFYKFMESICTKNEIKENEFNNDILLAVLFASCYAADNMAIADAVCRGLRKITKNQKLEIQDWNALREKVKGKITTSNDIQELKTVLDTGLKYLSVDNNLVTKILKVAEKTSHKKKVTLRSLFSQKH